MSDRGNGIRSAADRGDGSQSTADRAADPSPVAVDGLSVSFGDIDAVRDISLTVERGELVGLVGPNGAGKTTVLRAIKGTVTPDTGTVRLAGDHVSELSAAEAGRRVASVPQSTDLSFDFQVRHVIEMGRTPHIGRFSGHDADDATAVHEAMVAAGVERFADRSIRSVSGGERQRVLLARALAQETPVLLLDEPTASLDVNHAATTAELVRGLVDDGRAALAAIHDLELAARYCDRLVLIAGGRVRAIGSPKTVLTRETLRETFDAETFVGSNPVTGSPTVTAFSRSEIDSRRVHVVGGGREAAQVVGRVAAAGHSVSAGVVPANDVTAVVADDAECPVVTAPPFETVREEIRGAAERLANTADVTVAVGEMDDPNRSVVEAAATVVRVETGESTEPEIKSGESESGTIPAELVLDAIQDASPVADTTEE